METFCNESIIHFLVLYLQELEEQTYDILFTIYPVYNSQLLAETSTSQNTTLSMNVVTNLTATRLTVGQSVIRVDLRDEHLNQEQITRETKITVFFSKPRYVYSAIAYCTVCSVYKYYIICTICMCIYCTTHTQHLYRCIILDQCFSMQRSHCFLTHHKPTFLKISSLTPKQSSLIIVSGKKDCWLLTLQKPSLRREVATVIKMMMRMRIEQTWKVASDTARTLPLTQSLCCLIISCAVHVYSIINCLQ